MQTTVGQDIEPVLERFRLGQLTEPVLRQALEQLRPSANRQDLLYLQASSTSLVSSLLGMTLVSAGEIVDGASAAGQWPYASVLEAIRDGWRVIKFPELALLLVEDRTVGLGCEFILEKWG